MAINKRSGKVLLERMEAYRQRRLEDCEGLLPKEVHGLLFTPFDPDRSPMVLKEDLDAALLERAPSTPTFSGSSRWSIAVR